MTHPATAAGDEVDAVAATVLACPGVSSLHGGGPRPLATYLPGRRVAGVRLDEQRIQLSVTVSPGSRVPDLVASIRASLAGLARGRPVDVHVADIQDPPLPIAAG
ncbi:MAG: hypothetical protein WCG47_08850 [Dermatophilaceae bacterium]